MRVLIILLCFFYSCGQQKSINQRSEKMYEKMRLSMVEDQIERRGVKDDRVLHAMREVPRHEFVPNHLKKYAYADEPLPIGEDQTISQPYIVAYMTEYLRLGEEDIVLEIGTGSGYQAAVLAEIADTVYTIEIVDVLAKRAEKTLERLGYENVLVKRGDGYAGWPEHAPYDAIIITAAPTAGTVKNWRIYDPATGRLLSGIGVDREKYKRLRTKKTTTGQICTNDR
jgi:protein-L-isoaspartate(D-aspartate) O-methyltransferase